MLPLTPLIHALRSVMLEGTSLLALGPQLALIVAWGAHHFRTGPALVPVELRARSRCAGRARTVPAVRRASVPDAVGRFVVRLAGVSLQPAVFSQFGDRLVGQLPRGGQILRVVRGAVQVDEERNGPSITVRIGAASLLSLRHRGQDLLPPPSTDHRRQAGAICAAAHF